MPGQARKKSSTGIYHVMLKGIDDRNPVKAGMARKTDRYPWSSYRQYLEAYNGKNTQLSTDRIMGYFQSKKQFETFIR